MGHNSELNLRIVGREQKHVWRANKRLAYAAPLGCANWYILQIGIGRRQPARCGNCLLKSGMNAASVCIDLQRQFVGVGRLEFRKRALFENHPRQLVVLREFGEHRFGSGGLAGFCLLEHGQLKLFIENRLQLFRRS